PPSRSPRAGPVYRHRGIGPRAAPRSDTSRRVATALASYRARLDALLPGTACPPPERPSWRRPHLDDVGRRRLYDRAHPRIPTRQRFALFVEVLMLIVNAFDAGTDMRKHGFANLFADS